MMNVTKFYPVLFVWNSSEKAKTIVNSKAPFDSAAGAIEYAYYADKVNGYAYQDCGYAFFNGTKWVAETQEAYEEGWMDDPDFVTRQELCHEAANARLEQEAMGW